MLFFILKSDPHPGQCVAVTPGALPLIHVVASQAMAWQPLPELPGGSAPNTSAPGTYLGVICCQPLRMVAPLGGEDSGGYCAIVTKQASE